MSGKKTLQPTKYAQQKYNITKPVDFEIAIKYGVALMAIAGADGELAEKEFQWYIDEQELMTVQPEEYLETLRKSDWKNVNIEELLSEIKYDFTVNFRRTMLYQAIKMCRGDQKYHDKEKASVARAADILGIEPAVVASIESLAELEDASGRLRLALFETEV